MSSSKSSTHEINAHKIKRMTLQTKFKLSGLQSPSFQIKLPFSSVSLQATAQAQGTTPPQKTVDMDNDSSSESVRRRTAYRQRGLKACCDKIVENQGRLCVYIEWDMRRYRRTYRVLGVSGWTSKAKESVEDTWYVAKKFGGRRILILKAVWMNLIVSWALYRSWKHSSYSPLSPISDWIRPRTTISVDLRIRTW